MGEMFSSKQTSNTTSKTQVPKKFQGVLDTLLKQSTGAAGQPFAPYTDPRIAGLSGNEQQGINAASSQFGMYQPLLDMATQNNMQMQQQGGIPTQTDLGNFINPYTDYVLGNSLNRLNEASDRNMTNIGSMAGMSGAFGGSRHGVLEGANLAELLKSTGELSANTYSNAFDKGMGNWFTSQGLRRGSIQDAMGIAGTGQGYNMGDINSLMSTGLTGRTQEQGQLDFNFAEFLRGQADPYNKAEFLSQIAGNYPRDLFTRTQNTTTTNTPSPISTIAGIGLTAAGLMTGNPAAMAGMGAGGASIGTMNKMPFGSVLGPPKNFKKGGKVKRFADRGRVIERDERGNPIDWSTGAKFRPNQILPDYYRDPYIEDIPTQTPAVGKGNDILDWLGDYALSQGEQRALDTDMDPGMRDILSQTLNRTGDALVRGKNERKDILLQLLGATVGEGTRRKSSPQTKYRDVTNKLAKGGHIVKHLAKGGGVYKKPDVNFTNTDAGYTSADVPVDDLIDPERVFGLALFKHESGASEFDNPDYTANAFRGKENSHAFGKGQWQPDTWNKLARRSNGKLHSISQTDVVNNRLPSKEEQDIAGQIEMDQLRTQYGNDYVARWGSHQAGATGWDKLSRAKPDTLVSSVIGARAAHNLGMDDKTVGDYRNRTRKELARAETFERQRITEAGGNLSPRLTGLPGDAQASQGIRGNKHGNVDYRGYTEEEINRSLKNRKDFDPAYEDYRSALIEAQGPQGSNENVLLPQEVPSGPRNIVPRSIQSPLDLLGGPSQPEIPYESLFTRGGKRLFAGGGYVKSYKGGRRVTPETNVLNFDPNDPNREFTFAPYQWEGKSILDLINPNRAIHRTNDVSSITANTPTNVQNESNMSQGPLGLLGQSNENPGDQYFNPALNETITSADSLTDGLAAGDYGPVLNDPLNSAQDDQDQELRDSLKDLIRQRLNDVKNQDENKRDPLFGLFSNANKPLIQMGLGILANSGYPNSFGEAVGKAGLGVLQGQEQEALAKNERTNQRLKDLLNLRYMNAMANSMDPSNKMALAQYNAQQKMQLERMKLQGKLDDARMRGDSAMERVIMQQLMIQGAGGAFATPYSQAQQQWMSSRGAPLPEDTTTDEDIPLD